MRSMHNADEIRLGEDDDSIVRCDRILYFRTDTALPCRERRRGRVVGTNKSIQNIWPFATSFLTKSRHT